MTGFAFCSLLLGETVVHNSADRTIKVCDTRELALTPRADDLVHWVAAVYSLHFAHNFTSATGNTAGDPALEYSRPIVILASLHRETFKK